MSRVLELTPAGMIRTRRQRWVIRDLVPEGVVTVLAGTGGIGKSTILAWITAGITNGTFDGDMKGTPASVAFIGAEDSLEATLIPRLRVAEADIHKVFDLSSVVVTDEKGVTYRSLPTISDDLQAIREVLVENGVKVLIVDPLISISDGDSNKAGDIRRNLDPLAAVAADLGIAIVCVVHFRKGGGNASESLSGSHAIRDAAKSVLLLAKDDETDQRILTVDKNNYSPREPSIAFTIDTVSHCTDDGEYAEVGKATLLGESLVTVHEIVRRGHDDSLGDVSASIVQALKAHGGEMSVEEVAEAVGEAPGKARTYLGRLVKSNRITRTGRGRYTVDTAVSGVSSVSSVSNEGENDTHDTHNTHILIDTPVSFDDYCLHGVTSGARCTRCGGSAVAA
jgi:hypothetical protein